MMGRVVLWERVDDDDEDTGAPLNKALIDPPSRTTWGSLFRKVQKTLSEGRTIDDDETVGKQFVEPDPRRGPASTRMALSLHRMSRDTPWITRQTLYAHVWGSLEQEERDALILEEEKSVDEKGAALLERQIRAQQAAERAAEQARVRAAAEEAATKTLATILAEQNEVMEKFMADNLIPLAKRLVETGRPVGLSRQAFEGEISKRAEAQRRAGESAAQAFTRYATTTEDGRVLFKAANLAAPDIAPPKVDPAPVRTESPAAAALNKRATELMQTNQHLTRASAISRIADSPTDRHLFAKARDEERVAVARAMAMA